MSLVCNENTKLADVVYSNPHLLALIERLDIALGFGEATVGQICKKHNLSPELFISICNIYTHKGYIPSLDKTTKDDILRLMEYLRTSHKYFQLKSLPALHSKIHALLKEGDNTNALVLNKFYDDYDREITHHFKYEEEAVFPYITSLLKKGCKTSKSQDRLRLDDFKENHSNIEEKLSDLKNIVLKYLPDSYPKEIRIEVLKDIFSIEADLAGHTRVEDLLLVPLVDELEKEA